MYWSMIIAVYQFYMLQLLKSFLELIVFCLFPCFWGFSFTTPVPITLRNQQPNHLAPFHMNEMHFLLLIASPPASWQEFTYGQVRTRVSTLMSSHCSYPMPLELVEVRIRVTGKPLNWTTIHTAANTVASCKQESTPISPEEHQRNHRSQRLGKC